MPVEIHYRTTTELHSERDQLIRDGGISFEELKELHDAGTLSAEEWATFDRLVAIDFLLQSAD